VTPLVAFLIWVTRWAVLLVLLDDDGSLSVVKVWSEKGVGAPLHPDVVRLAGQAGQLVVEVGGLRVLGE
jgi:hypothetical protein